MLVSPSPARRLIPVIAILLLAAATRTINVSGWPVWTDEGWSTWAASDHHLNTILDKVAQDRHPPLYFVSLSAWWTVAGQSRLALRFLAIAGGILSVAVVYRLGADWFSRQTGQYAALLIAVLDITVYYSQEIRHYSWLVLSVCLMMLFFLRYLRRPRRSLWIGYLLSVTFMFYSLYLGVFVLAVQIIVGLIFWQRPLRDRAILAGAWVGSLLLYAPWLIAIAQQANILAGGIDGLPTSLASLLRVSTFLLGGQVALTGGLYLLGCWTLIEARDSSMRWLAQMTLMASGIGLMTAMFVANLKIGMLSERTMVFLAPMLALITGYGLTLLSERLQRILIALLVMVALGTTDFLQPRLDSQLIARELAQEYSPGDLIILENGWDDNAVRYEITLVLPDPDSARIIRTLPWVDNRSATNAPVVPQVEADLIAARRVWIVNWSQPTQVIPFLDAGKHGYVRALLRQTPIGAQYKPLYADRDPMMRAVLFEKVDRAAPPRLFGGQMALHDALYLHEVKRGTTLNVDLWWSAAQQMQLDYSVGVFLQDPATGMGRTGQDGPPGDTPTTQWIPGKLFFDRHRLTIPADMPPGTYRLGVQVYWYGDQKRLPIEGADMLMLGEVVVR